MVTIYSGNELSTAHFPLLRLAHIAQAGPQSSPCADSGPRQAQREGAGSEHFASCALQTLPPARAGPQSSLWHSLRGLWSAQSMQ